MTVTYNHGTDYMLGIMTNLKTQGIKALVIV